MVELKIRSSKKKLVESKHAKGDACISIVSLYKSFRRIDGALVHAVEDLSLSVGQGEMLVLLGPSGCGKTSLLRCIAGLERPERGEIIIDGDEMFSSTKKINRPPNTRDIGMMFQSYALWPHMTVAKNVAYPLHGRKFKKQEVHEKVAEVLEMVGVAGLGGQYPGQLSGGQQQRVALARSLVTNPRVILFDEPLSNVDAKVREDLRIELMMKQKDLGFTGVYVTHDQVEAMQLADRLVVLDSGSIAQIDTPRAVYSRPADLSVARFVGTLNEVPGTLSAISPDGALEVSCALGTIVGRHAGDQPQRFKVGDRVIVGVRAEAIHIVTSKSQPRSSSNVSAGSLVTEGFAGAYAVRLFRVNDVDLNIHTDVDALTDESVEAGADVGVHFSRNDTMVFLA